VLATNIQRQRSATPAPPQGAERRRLLHAQDRLQRSWHWWSVTVRDRAVAHLDALTVELAAVAAGLEELDRLESEDATGAER
jgi:hypothetical protein